ncbi:hypothetical protein [Telluria beijingensis]|uniref:hypothetical protein n=1 Tax=Telluria beijingensis TaxID=3068633 RepID=UPI0027954746|nr:hypothetical protein [Massilia sp. REN29]
MAYALVAAMGHSFGYVVEKRVTDSRIAPHDRSNIDMPEDGLNRLVLHLTDKKSRLPRSMHRSPTFLSGF